MSEHLENAARALVAEGGADDSVKTASAADKQHLRGLLLAMSGCLGGLGTCLPAIDPAVPAEPGVPLSVIGQVSTMNSSVHSISHMHNTNFCWQLANGWPEDCSCAHALCWQMQLQQDNYM